MEDLEMITLNEILEMLKEIIKKLNKIEKSLPSERDG